MVRRDFYVVLGVTRAESREGIRRAFRDLALRYHPDRAGAQGSRSFREVVEAYRVLSDPERRAAYDESLRLAEKQHGSNDSGAGHAPYPADTDPRSSVEHAGIRGMHERLQSTLSEPTGSMSWPPMSPGLEVLATPGEAAAGGILALHVPLRLPCRLCRGAGYTGPFLCRRCSGWGIEETEEEVEIVIPRFVLDGTVLRVPLRVLGFHGGYLEVLVRVGS